MSRRGKGPHLYFRQRRGRDGVWVIRDGESEISTGERHDGRRGAEKALGDYIARKHTPDFGDGDPARIFVGDILTLYASEHAVKLVGDGPKTAGYNIAALTPFWGDKTCAQITPSNCDKYANSRRSEGRRDTTIRRELSVLSAAQNYAWRAGKLSKITPVSMPAEPEGNDRWLTRSEAARLLAGALGFYVEACDIATRRPVSIGRHLPWRSIQTARFILIGLYTGTRHSAAAGLRWGVNSESGWIDLETGLLHRSARGEKKTNKRKPTVRLSARMLGHMRRARLNTVAGPVEYRGQVVAEVDTAFNRARDIAGLGRDVTPHTLRHTAATWGLQNRAPPWELAGYLGMSLETLLARYGHHSPDHQSGAADAISGAKSGADKAAKRRA